jgi:hypothetical protein
MTSQHKYDNIQIKIKKFWEQRTGHNPHISGSGQHNSIPKKERTRAESKKESIDEWNSP